MALKDFVEKGERIYQENKEQLEQEHTRGFAIIDVKKEEIVGVEEDAVKAKQIAHAKGCYLRPLGLLKRE